MANELSVPHTPEEIAATKSFLREAFSHSDENLESFLKSPAGIEEIAELRQELADRQQRMARRPVEVQEKMRNQWKETATALDLPEDEFEAELELRRRGARSVAQMMTNGSKMAERYVDDFVKIWQEKGELPYSPYLPS